MTDPHHGQVDVRRAELEVAGGTVDGWVAEIGGTTATGHGREEALRNLVEHVWRESL
jgi:hypothetical protein